MTTYAKNSPGAPRSGFYTRGDVVVDSEGIEWLALVTGFVRDDIGATWTGVSGIPDTQLDASNTTLEEVPGPVPHVLTLTLVDVPITVTNGNAYGSVQLCTFAAGIVQVFTSVSSMQWKAKIGEDRPGYINADATVSWSVGHLATTHPDQGTAGEADIMTKTQIQIPDGFDYGQVQAAGNASDFGFDGSTDGSPTGFPLQIFLNVGFETADEIDGDSHLLVSGTIRIVHINFGDY